MVYRRNFASTRGAHRTARNEIPETIVISDAWRPRGVITGQASDVRQ